MVGDSLGASGTAEMVVVEGEVDWAHIELDVENPLFDQ